MANRALFQAITRERIAESRASGKIAPGGVVRGAHVAVERKKWMALYSLVGNFRAALAICDDVIIWRHERQPEYLLREWALDIDDGLHEVDPAAERLMRKRVEAYMSQRHREFIWDNMEAAAVITKQIKETGKAKQAVALSYVGNNINYGMDKGGHAEVGRSSVTNIGNVKIVSARQPQVKVLKEPKYRDPDGLRQGRKPAELIEAVATHICDAGLRTAEETI